MTNLNHNEGQDRSSQGSENGNDKISDQKGSEKEHVMSPDKTYMSEKVDPSTDDYNIKENKNMKDDFKGKKENKRQVSSVQDDDSGIPYDRGWAWMVDLGCFVLYFIYVCHDHWTSVLLMDYLNQFDITVSVVTAMLSVGSLIYMLATQISVNVLVARFSIRVVLTSSAISNVLATLLFTAAPNIGTFFIVNFVKYVFKGFSLIPALVLVGFYFRRRRGLAATLGLLGISCSHMCAPPMIRYLRDEYGFRGCFLILAGMEMHGIVAALLLRPINSYKQRKITSMVPISEREETNQLIAKNLDNQSEETTRADNVTHLDMFPLTELNEDKISLDVTDELVPYESSNVTNVLPKQAEITCSTSKDNSNYLHEEENVKIKSGKFPDEPKCNIDGSLSEQINTENDEANGEVQRDILENSSDASKGKVFDTHLTNERIDNFNSEISTIPLLVHDMTPSAAKIAESNSNINVERGLLDSHNHDVHPTSHESYWSLATISAMGSIPNIVHVMKQPQPSEDVKPESRFFHRCQWIKKLISVPLLKNYLACMIIAMYFLSNTARIGAIYLPSYAKSVGVSPQKASLLLTIFGSMNIVSRIFFGFLADLKWIRPHLIIAITCAILGTVMQFVVLLNGFEKLAIFAVVFGFLSGVGHNLTTVLIVDVVGIQHLSKLMAMCSMFNSVWNVMQHPIQGVVYEATGTFAVTYIYAGTCVLFASVMLFCKPLIHKLQKTKEKKRNKI